MMKVLDRPSIVMLAEVMETEQTLDPVTEYASGEGVRRRPGANSTDVGCPVLQPEVYRPRT